MAKVNPIQVQKYLKGVKYPVNKQDLLKHVEKEGADQNMRSSLEQLPDQQFDTPADVSKAIGKIG